VPAVSRMPGTIRRWHWGKLAILWAWGGGISGLLLTGFLSTPPREHPALSLVMLLGTVAIVASLSVITWVWLGGKETGDEARPG